MVASVKKNNILVIFPKILYTISWTFKKGAV